MIARSNGGLEGRENREGERGNYHHTTVISLNVGLLHKYNKMQSARRRWNGGEGGTSEGFKPVEELCVSVQSSRWD